MSIAVQRNWPLIGFPLAHFRLLASLTDQKFSAIHADLPTSVQTQGVA